MCVCVCLSAHILLFSVVESARSFWGSQMSPAAVAADGIPRTGASLLTLPLRGRLSSQYPSRHTPLIPLLLKAPQLHLSYERSGSAILKTRKFLQRESPETSTSSCPEGTKCTRFRCFPETMVTSVHPRGCNSSTPVPHSWQREGVCPGRFCTHSFMASGPRGAASPEVAFLLHHEAITFPRGARSRGHRDCMAPFLAGGFNRRAVPHRSQAGCEIPQERMHPGRGLHDKEGAVLTSIPQEKRAGMIIFRVMMAVRRNFAGKLNHRCRRQQCLQDSLHPSLTQAATSCQGISEEAPEHLCPVGLIPLTLCRLLVAEKYCRAGASLQLGSSVACYSSVRY
ncbi:uncharacterized protein LOC128143235 isoform X1 [Harpia harpyja]|uniref:uncharacterized protein LOC128143235 isoform X1 n=1 Tax=Harpia harpyja TaxID=202280 RepID=UPI0022B10B77|nr:uncharacterized protein LOC128143235 isoform X1 [Harpia harpyja]